MMRWQWVEWCPQLVESGLEGSEVHVWRAPLDVSSEVVRHYERLLSPDEWSRVSRFRSPGSRRRFIVRRGFLRSVLGIEAAMRPECVVFEYGAEGKPRLLEPEESKALQFNASHSSDWALVAVARGTRIGIDVERERSDVDHKGIAERYFAPREAAAVAVAPRESRSPLFFHYWAAKEAWLKATGEGLSRPLGSFEVRFDADGLAAQVVDLRDRETPLAWRIYLVEAAAGYSAALAVEHPQPEIRLWDWSF